MPARAPALLLALLLALALPFALPLTAQAQSAEAIGEVLVGERREVAASDAIVTGVVEGLIDEAETRRLVTLVERVRALQERAYADGRISPRERTRLDLVYRRLERAIARARVH